MLILRIRQSEVALADGRLDEAYDLAEAHAFASHRRGQRLVGNLVDAFIRRGNEHLKNGRFALALSDCEKAGKLGGNQPEIAALRAAAGEAIESRRRCETKQEQAVADARRLVDQGFLDRGIQRLAGAANDVTRVRLVHDDIEHRKTTAAHALRAARGAMENDELHQAVTEISAAMAAQSQDPQATDLLADLRRKLREAVGGAIQNGALDRAANLLGQLRRIDPDGPATREHQVALELLAQTWQHIQEGNFSAARIAFSRVTGRLLNGNPAACPQWMSQVKEQLEISDRTAGELRSSVLSSLECSPTAALAQTRALPQVRVLPQVPAKLVAAQPQANHFAALPPMNEAVVMPGQFVLQVDGVGAFLVIRQATVTLGPISSSIVPDIAFIADATSPTIQIDRVDEDYFVKPAGGAGGRLLGAGEKIEISARCRMTFGVPNAASTSAVLDLSGARLARADIRRIILMDQDLIIGPGTAAHVPTGSVAEPMVLHLRQGQLYCKTSQPLQIDGQMADAAASLPMSRAMNVGGLSFVLTPASTSMDRR